MFRIAHVSDLHLLPTRSDRAFVDRLIASWGEHEVDHVVITGDVTHDGDAGVIGWFDRALRRSGWNEERCTVLGGNHDLRAKRSFRRRFGWEVCTFRMLDNGRVGLVTVDSVKHGGLLDRNMWSPRGWLTGNELAALDDALDRCAGCAVRVLALHHHLFHTPVSDLDWLTRLGTVLPGRLRLWGPLQNAEELLEKAQQRRVQVILSGHSHTPQSRRIGGVRCYVGGGTTTFEEYRVLSVDDRGTIQVRWAQP